MSTQPLKILVSAFACNPDSGSEEGVGWGWVKAIAKTHRVWVLTADFHRAAIEKAVRRSPHEFSRISFEFVSPRPWHYAPTTGWRFIENSMLKPVMNQAYRLWQRDSFYKAKELQWEINFDIVHQLTYVGFRFPGQLWKLNVPFVWGPIGGLENTPWRFLPGLGFGGYIYYAGRNIVNSFDKRYLPGPKKAFRKGRGGLIAATTGIQNEIAHWYGVDSDVICEIGPPPDRAKTHSIRKSGEKLRLSWSGQHLPGKALPLLLRALSLLPSRVRWQLDVLGHGPSTEKWQQLTKKMGIARRCQWHGQISRTEAIKQVHQSHLFVITSLKDLTSTVLLEAMAQGVPVICPDHCGFTDVVTNDCGIKVAVCAPRQLTADLAGAIMLLEKNEEKRRRLATGALRRINDFTWEEKSRRVDLVYQQLANMRI